jgi:1-pyrroline-5-carboxylate dehydrogenase
MTQIYGDQPTSTSDMWNRLEYRPLEGFVRDLTLQLLPPIFLQVLR